MDALVYRMALAGVALGPALALATIPALSAALPMGLAVGGVSSVVAMFAALRGGRGKLQRLSPVLLRRGALRRPNIDLPSLTDQRQALADALEAAIELRAEPEAPPTRATAIARILLRILESWHVTDVASLPRDLTLALTLLDRLLTEDPGEAGRIAQMFQRPDVVLGLRQEIDKIARTRAVYDRAFAAFQATRLMYAADPAPRSLIEALRSLGTEDIDLWHHVICAHDPSDPAQRDAALWCLAQPGCDRATVAAYMSRMAEGGQLQNAYIDDECAYLSDVRGIIDNCNAGLYRHQGLAYMPDENSADLMSAELDALAALSDTRRWPDPQCVFADLEGRTPRPRPAWDLARGRLTAPPRRADYL